MDRETPPLEKGPEFRDFSEGAFRLYQTITQLGDSIETDDTSKGTVNLMGRMRAETAASLLKELPKELDESMLAFRTKILAECLLGLRNLNSEDVRDKELKEEALNIIEQLKTL
ncbi:MAG: hypothetical protein A2826_01795 [Candidatus Doudnabacteria bacterium RIFCSPHIGHO2_01_FULL_43_23]|uniref:Uncharacterized protein n=1 Tax=Candidatus Doudnabacteria bacterium RIFCSPHIGHO2_01_FULL_43_23 TaxID=1817822 RepID=A0A1F5NVK0_9BACT|nr:MAG: hypothetical protein A2826_01795 [Candidatus Doudnabacteria bacterium RIFCSPHIGHO2_01_FULL_43_23]